MENKKFNPFYDSKFLISIDGNENFGRRMLVEMYPDDLEQLKSEIEVVLKWYGEHYGKRA